VDAESGLAGSGPGGPELTGSEPGGRARRDRGEASAARPAPAEEQPDGPESILSALDPEQREVAVAARGPVCVLAGAGTGKTRAVAHRIAYAVWTGVVDPGHVLALTFTTRAAGELRGRLRQLGAADIGMERVQARTFHAAALRQLKHFWPRTVGGRPPAVLDSKISLLSEAARRLRLTAGLPDIRDIASEIEWSKVTQVRPDDYPAAAARAGRMPPLGAEKTARMYAAYEELRRERHLVDFESVLELTAAIIAEHRPAAAAVRDRYRYFVVDEYQDVNPLQKLLLESWAGDRDDICVVGDPRQTIYSFTGATPAYLTGFTAEFPDATVVRLVRNYRSTPQVVALANQLTGAGAARPLAAQLKSHRLAVPGTGGAPLVAQQPAGDPPGFAEYRDDQSEASSVAAQAAELISGGVPPRQIAVLVRTNAQTPLFEQALTEVGVPCQVRGAERFFDRAEVRQAVGLLRAAVKSARRDAEPPGGVSGLADDPGGHADSAAAAAAAALSAAASAEVRHILAGVGLTRTAPPGRGAARERWESLEALAQLAQDFFTATPGASLTDFAAELAHRTAIEHAPAMEGVTLASLHAAKGLEWDVVFLPGLSDGNLPIVHAQTDEAVEEERRLLYVGVTRARQRVYLSWSLARSGGGRRSRKPSRFLDDVRPGRRAGHGDRAAGDRTAGDSTAREGTARGRRDQAGADAPAAGQIRFRGTGVVRRRGR
jgi:DNA helicase-2/ATP-dependent DNA helicase PcrA